MRMETVQMVLIIAAVVVGIVIIFAGGKVVDGTISAVKEATKTWLGF